MIPEMRVLGVVLMALPTAVETDHLIVHLEKIEWGSGE